jgi:TRAP transporter TAXI family solute receptor
MRDGLLRKLLVSLALGVIVALVVGMVAVLFLGRPPTSFKLAAGQSGGMYATFASALKNDLATVGTTVEIIETAGSVENAELLRTGKADVALIQSGTELLTDIGGSSALSEVFYEPFWIFARQGVIEVVDGIPILAGKRLAIGPAGSGTNATARALIALTGSTAIPLEWTTDEAIAGLADGTIDAAFLVLAANAPLIAELAAIPDLDILTVPNVDGLARRLPFLSPVVLFRGVFDPGVSPVPPADMTMLAARATLMGREGLNPDLVRLIVRELPAVLPVPYVGDLDAFPSLDRTQFAVNEDARKYLDEGPTPLESFLPFEIASPLSRVYLILLPLLVLMFPLYTLIKAGWEWVNNRRIVSWYPRINAIERNLDSSDLDELMAQQDFLLGLDAQLARPRRLPAGKMGSLYQLRTHLSFVIRKVEGRIAELGGEGAIAVARANDTDPTLDPGEITDEAMGLDEPDRGAG